MRAVIQAGGQGTRLRPYTFVVPKPLMPVGEQPVIEMLLKWLRRWGIKEACITTGYLGHLISTLCGDGSQWDMEIQYSNEREPLGTIGPLANIKDYLTDMFLVLNGDLITDLDINDFVGFHKSSGAQVTVACTDQVIDLDFGVIDAPNGDGRMAGFREKPSMAYQVSMGIYCMEPAILDLIPRDVPFGFDNLMHTMLLHDMPVYTYKHKGLWLDIGQEKDFTLVQERFANEYKSLILGY
jgi:mannose-1-phosphate guanylyltransferase